MPQTYEKEIREMAGLAGEAMDAHTTALFLVEEPHRETLAMAAGVSPSPRLIPNAVIKIGHGLVGWVAKHGRPASAALKGEASNLLFYSGEEDVKSFAAAPIYEGDRLMGVLAVDSKSPDIFTERQIRLLARFAQALGAMIVQSRKQARLSSEMSDVKALAELAEAMTHGMDQSELVRLLRARLAVMIPHDHLALAIRNLKTGEYELLGGGPAETGNESQEPFSVTHFRFGWVIHQARPVYLADVNAPVIPGDGGRWRSFIGAPVIADGEVYGAVGLLSLKPQAFKRGDAGFLAVVAAILASAIITPALKELARASALTDPVTKTIFYRTLLERHKDLSPSGVVALVDLKGFRHVNKELLPRGGDSVLAQMADRLKKSIGASGDVSRYFADTFMCILPGTSIGQAKKALMAAMDEIDGRPFHYGGVDAHITPVAGASSCPEEGKGAEELLLKAQDALTAAKKEPGRKLLFYGELGSEPVARKVAT
jgi:diguanylate cyclase (GGDEF)-like protein